MNILLISLIGGLILLIILGLAIVNYSGENLFLSYKKYLNFYTTMTPINFIEIISQKYFNGTISYSTTPKTLGDSYCNNHIKVSSNHCNKNTLAGLTIVAHELGHAFQYKNTPEKMHSFTKNLKLSQNLSKLIIPLLIASIVLILYNWLYAVICVSIAFLIFIFALSLKFSTIKIEREASTIALSILEKEAYLNESELKEAKEFLNNAKLTYIADFLRAMLKWTMLVRKYY